MTSAIYDSIGGTYYVRCRDCQTRVEVEGDVWPDAGGNAVVDYYPVEGVVSADDVVRCFACVTVPDAEECVR